MTFQLGRTFGSEELAVIETVLGEWRGQHGVDAQSPDSMLAGAVLVSLFQAGNLTYPTLAAAARNHKWLAEYGHQQPDHANVNAPAPALPVQQSASD